MSIKSKIIKIIKEPILILSFFKKKLDLSAIYDISLAKKIINGEFKTIIDVGSNFGYYSKVYLEKNRYAKVYSFEPVKICFYEQLKIRNKRFFLFNFALGEDNYRSKINTGAINYGGSSFLNRKDKSNSGFEYCDVKRFDSLNIKLNNPCLLKLDVEGYELKVLKGFGKLLNEIDVIQIEVNFGQEIENTPNYAEICSLIVKYGFSGFIQDNLRKDMDGKIIQCDLFFYKIR